ncbi:MAG: hypothetical protein JXX14_02635 [Deltaproteobacteria bacterium]|nr:hypothetical protein [Deltaproteobacteria bacterium]
MENDLRAQLCKKVTLKIWLKTGGIIKEMIGCDADTLICKIGKIATLLDACLAVFGNDVMGRTPPNAISSSIVCSLYQWAREILLGTYSQKDLKIEI